MADRIGAVPAVRGTACCPVTWLVAGVEGSFDLPVGEVVLAIDAVGVTSERLLLGEGDVGDLPVEVVEVAGGAVLVVVGFGGPVAAGVPGTDGEVAGVGGGEVDGAGEAALELPVEVEGLAAAGGGEDGVVPQAVVDAGGGGDGGGGAVGPLGVEFAVGSDVQDGCVAAGVGGAGGQGLVLQGDQDPVGGSGLEPDRDAGSGVTRQEGGGGRGEVAGLTVEGDVGAEVVVAGPGGTAGEGGCAAGDGVGGGGGGGGLGEGAAVGQRPVVRGAGGV
jgi:hypothetical protein